MNNNTLTNGDDGDIKDSLMHPHVEIFGKNPKSQTSIY